MTIDRAGFARIFENLIVYDSYQTPFVDRYAQFGVTFEPGGTLGLAMVQIRSAYMTYQVTSPTLQLWVCEGGRLVSVQRSRLTCLPWCVEEEGQMGECITVRTRHVFLDHRSMASEFVFANEGRDEVTVVPVWLGQFPGDRFRRNGEAREFGYVEADPPLRESWVQAHGATVQGGLRNTGSTAVLPLPSVRIVAGGGIGVAARVSGAPQWAGSCAADSSGLSRYYSFETGTLRLTPRTALSVVFTIELAVATYLEPAVGFDDRPFGAIDMDAAVERSRADFERRVGWERPVVGTPTMRRRLWRCRCALLRTGYRASGSAGEFGNLIASTCVPNCGGFTRVFFWDSLFTSVALSQFEPEFARGAIRAVFARQDAAGRCPEHSFNYHLPARSVIGAPQAPVATWAIMRYLMANPRDTAFAVSMYPYLVRNHAYWVEQGDRDRDGLAEWTWSGQTADNSPLYDEYVEGGGCGWIPPIASVQLNAFLYRDALLLAELAQRLGKKQEAAAYRAAAAARADALTRICYVASERRFWDFNHTTGRHRRVKTFYMFWPIWAGMPVNESVRRELIEKVLLDEKQFFGPLPFPSVAYDESSYDPRGYWRGRSWPHISYWLLQMLVREGYRDAADEGAGRILGAFLREPSFPENFATDPGLVGAAGAGDYNWGAAAFYLIATGDYARDEAFPDQSFTEERS